MESLLTWQEKLNALEKGCTIPAGESVQSIYSAIRNHFADSEKQFSIRTEKKTKLKFVIRTK